ncbi:MAG: putative metal-dependent hydrolase [Bacteroidetes bacterium]|nr:putative metal-dependent hydrolase [Bacteroidota bacterium]
MEHLKYPYGRFEYGKTYSKSDTERHIAAIAALPEQLNALAAALSNEQLEKSYRPGGWNARQIIHHIADSHSNALIRVKLALTENSPVIKPYDQDAWSELEDATHAPIASSLKMVEAIHERWIYVLKAMSESDFSKKYIHPEYKREFRLDEFIVLYAWHGKQHCGHLQLILEQN